MGRTICCAIFALLAMSGTAFSQSFGHRHVTHYHGYAPHYYSRSVVRVPHFYGWSSRWLRPYVPLADQFALPYPAVDYTLPSPSYVFVGSASVSYPQLIFNDGTTYTVADYWREDDQLHFITVEEGGAKLVPHTAAFGDLDLDRTKDRAKAGGFKFLVRDKPIEQWLDDRAQESGARGKKDHKK